LVLMHVNNILVVCRLVKPIHTSDQVATLFA
jgi:hypothetical protein